MCTNVWIIYIIFYIRYIAVEARPTTEVQPKSPSSKTDEELLRDFDLTLEYGPCIGMETWHK